MLANILDNQEVSPGYFRLTLDSPELVQNTRPGQFVMMKVNEHHDPLLRRPMGICKISKSNGTPSAEFLYQVLGKGTTIMSKMKKDQQVDLIGPFGNGFTVPQDIKKAVFVAGGTGIAPLVLLAEKMVKELPDLKTYLFAGGKNKNDILCLEDFKKLNTEVHIATEDNSLGSHGLVTNPLEKFINKEADNKSSLFACGPHGMLKEVANLTIKRDIPCQVSLERKMACGFGVCLGCVIEVSSNNGRIYKNVCTDGPVFNAKEVVW